MSLPHVGCAERSDTHQRPHLTRRKGWKALARVLPYTPRPDLRAISRTLNVRLTRPCLDQQEVIPRRCTEINCYVRPDLTGLRVNIAKTIDAGELICRCRCRSQVSCPDRIRWQKQTGRHHESRW